MPICKTSFLHYFSIISYSKIVKAVNWWRGSSTVVGPLKRGFCPRWFHMSPPILVITSKHLLFNATLFFMILYSNKTLKRRGRKGKENEKGRQRRRKNTELELSFNPVFCFTGDKNLFLCPRCILNFSLNVLIIYSNYCYL